VPRPELVARLCDTRRYRLATIQAAAGFGKTSLLSQCYERIRGEQPAAWLSLDASDNDYARFLAHLFAAIEASGVEPGREFKYVARFGSASRPALARICSPGRWIPLSAGSRSASMISMFSMTPQRAAVVATTPGSAIERLLATGEPYCAGVFAAQQVRS